MITIKFTIELISDCESGSGFGTEILNGIVPRDGSGRPYIPATHLKGLLRDRLAHIGGCLGWPSDLDSSIFGREGTSGDDGVQSAIRISDARAGSSNTLTISRTAVGDLGTADQTTLRTVEALAAGTELVGTVQVDGAVGGVEDLVTRLCLLSVDAIGGGRNRGAGACSISLDNKTRSPGTLLKDLCQSLAGGADLARGPGFRQDRGYSFGTDDVTWLVLTFRAQSPICCPETPVVSNNVIRSGLAIPASAVQGALLTWLSRLNPGMATACFESPNFRVWPLLPCGSVESSDLPMPVRVSLTHRMSKLPGADGCFEFRDSAIEPYDWRAVAAGSPLKSVDGVLLKGKDGVRLWKGGEIPRLFTAHGVHYDATGEGRRNLFSVESVAPLAFRGLLALPKAAADVLMENLRTNPNLELVLGKARSVRGNGQVALEPYPIEKLSEWFSANPVLVVQSPLAIPDDWSITSAENALMKLVEIANWGTPRELSASLAIRFGWNRHGQGNLVGENRRLRARRTVMPGSVIAFRERPRGDFSSYLLRGLGDGREQGFGAVLPHPGIAAGKYEVEPEIARVKSKDEAGMLAMKLVELAGNFGPSRSQIAGLCGKLRAGQRAAIESHPLVAPKSANEGGNLGAGQRAAIEYLAEQEARHDRFADQWATVSSKVKEILQKDYNLASRTFRAWQDLTDRRQA